MEASLVITKTRNLVPPFHSVVELQQHLFPGGEIKLHCFGVFSPIL